MHKIKKSIIERYERKFIFKNTIRNEVENLIKLNIGGFKEVYKERYINNVYFDDYLFSSFFDNVNGTARRYKYRIRWYGKFIVENKPANFEIKKKRGALTIKETFPLKKFSLKSFLKKNSTSSDFNFFQSKNKLKYNFIKPVLVNRYKRKYFLSRDKLFRLTVDSDQVIGNPNNINSLRKINNLFSPIILEIKYDRSYDKYASKITSGLTTRLSKYSKYVNSLDCLYRF